MKIPKNKLVDLYLNQHKTMQQIADIIHCSRAHVFASLRWYNIRTRKRGTHTPWNKGSHIFLGGGVKQGNIPWNKGLTKETDERVKLNGIKSGKSNQGRVIWNKNKSWSNEAKVKMSISAKQRWQNPEEVRKISLIRGGTGIPYENTEYGSEFDTQLKEQVRFRDKYKCRICGCSQLENGRQLDIHHIDYDKRNNNLNNLIALCHVCHTKTNYKRQIWKQYFINLTLT